MSTALWIVHTAVAGLPLVAGIVYLFLTRRRSPRAAGRGIAALAGMTAVFCCTRVAFAVLPLAFGNAGFDPATVYYAVGTLFAVLEGGFLLALVTAVMAGRPRPPADD